MVGCTMTNYTEKSRLRKVIICWMLSRLTCFYYVISGSSLCSESLAIVQCWLKLHCSTTIDDVHTILLYVERFFFI